MSSTQKWLLDSLGGTVLIALQRKLERKSPADLERYGERLGKAFYQFGKRRRLRALNNLELAMPDLGPKERADITKRVFTHFGRTSADFFSARCRDLFQLESSTEIVGREYVEEALALGKGVLLVTGHFGNWERASAWLSFRGFPVSVVIRDADQSQVNQIVNGIRTASGTKIIPRGNAARPILEALRSNEIVGILPDQNAEDIYLPFFGKPAGTNLGVGVFRERTGAALLPVTCTYQGQQRYRIQFDPLLQPLEGYETRGEGTLRAFHIWLESKIRDNPDQWLWFHDRWRNARDAGLL